MDENLEKNDNVNEENKIEEITEEKEDNVEENNPIEENDETKDNIDKNVNKEVKEQPVVTEKEKIIPDYNVTIKKMKIQMLEKY